jgi:dTDP-4-dehydrorhamnose reductase
MRLGQRGGTQAAPLTDWNVLITGAGGQLGQALTQAIRAAGGNPLGLSRQPGYGISLISDVRDADALERAVNAAEPDTIIHAAAMTNVDACEQLPAEAAAINTRGSANVAHAAHRAGAHLIAISTDYVFSGRAGAPYSERDTPDPVSVYGRTKRAGEEEVLAVDPGFAVVRTAWLFGGAGRHFPRTVLRLLLDHGRMEAVTDERGNPTSVHDLAAALVTLITLRGAGIFHLTNTGTASRYELAQAVAVDAGYDPAAVTPVSAAEFRARRPLPAPRPADSSLENHRAAALGITLRPWRQAVAAYVPHLAREMIHDGEERRERR